jgi:hypothetical protein
MESIVDSLIEKKKDDQIICITDNLKFISHINFKTPTTLSECGFSFMAILIN